ncbi:putative nucleotide diphosphatase [Helianthus anomalus]
MLMPYEYKSAYALCIFSLAIGPNSRPLTFVGKTPVWLILFMLCFTGIRQF